MRRHFIIIFLMAFNSLISAQETPHKCIGIRGGDMSGITFQHFQTNFLANELLLSFRNEGVQLTFLRQNFKPTLGEIGKNFWFSSGYGLHAGFMQANEFRFLFTTYIFPNRRMSPLVGADGYLGLSYRFQELPIILGIDYKPYFEISGYDFFSLHLWDTALTIQYVFD